MTLQFWRNKLKSKRKMKRTLGVNIGVERLDTKNSAPNQPLSECCFTVSSCRVNAPISQYNCASKGEIKIFIRHGQVGFCLGDCIKVVINQHWCNKPYIALTAEYHLPMKLMLCLGFQKECAAFFSRSPQSNVRFQHGYPVSSACFNNAWCCCCCYPIHDHRCKRSWNENW